MGDDQDRIPLTKNWSLRKLIEGNPLRQRWALQYLGMDWLVISEFLPPGKDGRSTIDDEMRKFAAEVADEYRRGIKDEARDFLGAGEAS